MTTSVDLMRALGRRFPATEWLLVDEVMLPGGQAHRRIDAVAVHYWPSTGHMRCGFELKISRSDWTREMAQPEKRRFALERCHAFSLVSAAGIAREDEIPAEMGWYEFEGDALEIRKAPPQRTVPDPGPSFHVAVARRAEAAGRRNAALEAERLPGWHWIETMVRNLLSDPGNHAQEQLAQNVVADLRRAGRATEARAMGRIVRETARTRRDRARMLEDARFSRLFPLPAACPSCAAPALVRTAEDPLRARCTACGAVVPLTPAAG